MRLEGGNDLVSQPLIRKLVWSCLTSEWFKRRELNIACSRMAFRTIASARAGGRYSLTTDFDFMMRMGLWCENFAVPVVLNECMLQKLHGQDSAFSQHAEPWSSEL